MNTSQEWIARENKYCANTYDPLPVVLERGEGVWLWDLEGKRYLDMMSAYSAISLGHCHPRLVKVLNEQAHKLCVVSRAFHVKTLSPYIEKLCQLTGLDMVMPLNTGVEAVEAALKAARRWGYEKKGIPDNQAEIIVAKHNFHGRTLGVISFSTEESYKTHFGPLLPGFVTIPFGDLLALEKAITPNTCAFLVEPIQGEGGIHLPPKGWLKQCREVCQQNQVLFILDEIQTGLGRTGKLFAFEHEDALPDGLILGKALGGGILPVSAFVSKKELMSVFTPGSHGSTFGGNPLACRIALEVLTLIEEYDLAERSRILGEELFAQLKAIKSPLIQEVRGKGLWVGVEVDPKIASARQVCEKMMMHGVLSKDTHGTVIRFAPPLIIERETLNWATEQFEKAIRYFE